MGNIVLALGAVLSVGGALSIYVGAGIVQVERGWTGVIAGATALTGGIVVIALGLLIRAVHDLRRTVVGRMPISALPAVAAVQHDFLTAPEAVTDHTPAPSLVSPEMENSLLAAMTAPQAPDAEHEAARPAAVQETDHAPAAEATVAENAPAERPRPRIVLRSRPPEPEPEREPQPEPPPADDWLDRAFASIDEAKAHEEPLHEEPRHEASVHEAFAQEATPPVHRTEAPAHDLPLPERDEPHPSEVAVPHAAVQPPEPAVPEPAPDPAPHSLPPAPPDLVVIGRYEADGTAYVMYADGSIEAHHAGGVDRFRSMADLKAFIENAA